MRILRLMNTNKVRTRRLSTNLTLSTSVRSWATRLQKPLRQRSMSAVIELVIIQEAERLGLKKSEAA